MKNILITGGSGLIGQEVTRVLEEKGYEVAWLSRNPEKYTQKSFDWDVNGQKMDSAALSWCDGLIHLAGAGVAEKRWTDERKREILSSRVLSTLLLYDQLKTMNKRPEAVIASSAVGYYGMSTEDKLMHEGSSPGDDFLADVVKKWEAESEKFSTLGIRTVKLRIGIVLAKDGGALKEMLKPPVAAPLGSGRQYMSWIHIRDLAEMFVYALENQGIQGEYNAVGPVPVSNMILTLKAAKAVNKPFINIGVPKFGLKILLGEMADMVLGGNRVSNDKIQSSGFMYRFPLLDMALADIYN
jgi:uncharacterized protein (TIGR01777 family)